MNINTYIYNIFININKYNYIIIYIYVIQKESTQWLGASIFEEWSKNFFSLVEYSFFTAGQCFYCWIADRGVQNMWTNILFFNIIQGIMHSYETVYNTAFSISKIFPSE